MSNEGCPRRAEEVGPARVIERPSRCLRAQVPATRIDLDSDGPTVSVVPSALNEARNLPWLVARTPAGVADIILGDGRSTDDAIRTIRSLWPEARTVQQNRRGKG